MAGAITALNRRMEVGLILTHLAYSYNCRGRSSFIDVAALGLLQSSLGHGQDFNQADLNSPLKSAEKSIPNVRHRLARSFVDLTVLNIFA